MDKSEDYPREDGPIALTQAEFEAVLDADEADVAAGRTIPAEPILAEMRATAERIRRERHSKEAVRHKLE